MNHPRCHTDLATLWVLKMAVIDSLAALNVYDLVMMVLMRLALNFRYYGCEDLERSQLCNPQGDKRYLDVNLLR